MMKRIIFFVLSFAVAAGAMACTNLIVGKKASADGSVMCSYNCDGFGFAGSLFYSPAGRHARGERVAIRGWGPQHEGRFVEQVEYTYNVVGLMNERQVTIVETTFDGRLELQNHDGLLDYFSLMRLALQRSATAREAIRCMAELVEEYGYNSSGESITVCDPEEAWIMEIIGKGEGRKGAVWVALRIPDDCISAHANLSRICLFPHEGECWDNGSIVKQRTKRVKEYKSLSSRHLQYIDQPQVECVYAADVIDFAREKGYFNGSEKEFSFRDAYCPIDFENVRYADARVWSFFRHHCPDMDEYLPYIEGHFDICDRLPLWVKPEAPLSLQDVQRDMRDHFEGTPLDIDDVGGVTWFNCDDADMVAYVPLYCCITQVPDCFRPENNPRNEFSFESAFWMNNWVANMVYPRYSMMIGDLRKAQQELEDYYFVDQDSVLATIKDMAPLDRRDYLNKKSIAYADRMMQRWDRLAKYLIVKYNDQVVRKVDDKGGFQRWGYDTPGYDQQFINAIGTATGDRYRLKKVIERRER